MAKRLKKPDRAQNIPIESVANRYADDNKTNQFSENGTAKLNVDVRYERDAKTSDHYQTMNIPDRFEHPCEWQIVRTCDYFAINFKSLRFTLR